MGDPECEEKSYRGIFLQEFYSNDSHRERSEWVQKAVVLFREHAEMDPAEVLQASTRHIPGDMMLTIERMPYYVSRYLGVLPCEMGDKDKLNLDTIVTRQI